MFTNFYQKSFYPLVELCIYPENSFHSFNYL